MAKEQLTFKQKQAYNASIDSQIAELQTERQKYIDAKEVAEGLKGVSESLSASATDINKLLKQIKINHKAVGDGYFNSNVKGRIEGYSEDFNSIMNKCDKKIEELDGEINKLKSQYIFSDKNIATE